MQTLVHGVCPCHALCPCPSCMSMSMLHVLVHAACSNPCSTDMDMQQDMPCSKDISRQHGNSTPHILGHAVWTRTSCMYMDCSIDMDMQHVDGLVASTRHVLYVFIAMSMSTVAMGTVRPPSLFRSFFQVIQFIVPFTCFKLFAIFTSYYSLYSLQIIFVSLLFASYNICSLLFASIRSQLFLFASICFYSLPFVSICFYLLLFASIRSHLFPFASIRFYSLLFASCHICFASKIF